MQDKDVIIIGSGCGGLTAALALARSGRRVSVFEQHQTAGGYCQSFSIDGFSFSPGVQYVGHLGPGGHLRRIYEGLGVADDLVFLELDPDGYDRVFVGDFSFDIPAGRERFAERLRAQFPSEADGIDRYFEVIDKMVQELVWAQPEGIRDWLRLPRRMPTILRHGWRPLARFLDDFTRNPYLRAVLSIQCGDHGMPPARAPTIVHACVQDYYFEGACYPRGGGRGIVDALVGQIRKHGGEVVLGVEVERILVEGGKAIGVRLVNGDEVRAAVVISDADPSVTWGRLIEPQHVPPLLRRRVAKLRHSVSTVSLFLAVDMDLRAAGLDSGNVWYSRTTNIDQSFALAKRGDFTGITEIPGTFFSVTTLKDPSLRSDGLHTIEAMALSSARAFDRWRDLPPGQRGPEYEQLEQRLADMILDNVERIVPGLRERIVMCSVATPLTNIHYVRAGEGGSYGVEKSLRNIGPFGFSVRTPIESLYQCGASTLAAGIHGASNSGLVAAAAVQGCEPERLLGATGQSLRIYPADSPQVWPKAG